MKTHMWRLLLTILLVQLPLSAPLSAQLRTTDPTDRRPPRAFVVHFSPGGGVEQSDERGDRDRLRGALWGGGIGLVAGGLLGGLTVESSNGDDGFGGSLVESSATGEAVILGALVGAAIGAVLGSTVFAPAHREDGEVRIGSGFSASPLTSRGAVGLMVGFRR
jgi:hypothetical protein